MASALTLSRLIKVIYFGILILLDILRNVYKFGFTQVFQWKQIEKPKCLEDPTLGEHGYLTLKDVRVHYVASGPIKGPLMLFLHGFPEFWFSWRYQIREFNKDHRVVAVDMRGYGDSDKPKGIEAYSMRILISDVKEIIEALDYRSCTLVAHDWGGLIAWPFAKFYPDYVDKLIVLNIVPKPVLDFVVPRSRAQQERSWYVAFFQIPWIPELRLKIMNFAALRNIFTAANIKDPDVIDAYVYTYSRPGALTPPINYHRAFLRESGGGINYDARCNMPILLIWGCQDNHLSEECVDGLAQLVPDVHIKLIERANHFVAMEEPETVNRFMRDWLEG